MSKMKRILEVLLDVVDNLEALSGNLRDMASAIKSEYADSAELEVKKTPAAVQPKVSLEQVRAVLADKSQAGYTAEVRDLIAKYGSSKLSGIDPKHYPAILKEAEEIGNA